jgi:hypothetical protein
MVFLSGRADGLADRAEASIDRLTMDGSGHRVDYLTGTARAALGSVRSGRWHEAQWDP